MKLTFEQQKVFERAQALEKRALWFAAAVGTVALALFGWLILSGNWQNKFLVTMTAVVCMGLSGGAAGWLFHFCKELRGVISQLINADPQALAQQYEKTLGHGDSESISA